MKALLALLLSLALLPAQAADDQFWEHKDWKVFGERNAKGKKVCTAMTGGDGSDMFHVVAAAGGDISIYYQEQTYRGMKPVLNKNDAILFRFDDKKQTVYDDVSVFITVDAEGIPQATANLPSGYSAEVIRTMRASSSVSVLRENPKTGKPVLVSKFSLAGFTATLLKASEWCGFDANKLKTP